MQDKVLIVSEPLRTFYQGLARARSAEKGILNTPTDSLYIPCIVCSKQKNKNILK